MEFEQIKYLKPHLLKNEETDAIDLKNKINSTTQYNIIANSKVVNLNDIHNSLQYNNIKNFKNVNIIYRNSVNMKQIRDSGYLESLIFEFIKM